MRRHELSNEEWAIIAPLLPNNSRGIGCVDDRRVIRPFADASCLLCDPFHERGSACYLTARLYKGLAPFQGHYMGEVLAVGDHKIEPSFKDKTTLIRGFPAPQFECGICGGDRIIGFLRPAIGHVADCIVSGWGYLPER